MLIPMGTMICVYDARMVPIGTVICVYDAYGLYEYVSCYARCCSLVFATKSY